MKKIPVLFVHHDILFPHALLPLSVTDYRTCTILRQIFAETREVGVLYRPTGRSRWAATPRTGCTAFVEMVETLPEGRINLLLRGHQRFIVQQAPMETTGVKSLPAIPLTDRDFQLTAAEKMRLMQHLRRQLKIYLKSVLKIDTLGPCWEMNELDLAGLVHHTAMYLDITLDEKQQILELDALEKRYQFITAYLEEKLVAAQFCQTKSYLFEMSMCN